MNLKLGKRGPQIDRRSLKLSTYSGLAARQIPQGLEYDAPAITGEFPMDLNDQIGDCVIAAASHMIQQWTAYASKPVILSNAAVLKGYEDVGGYVPGDPSTDNGCEMLVALKYWRKHGFSGHIIDGFVLANPMLQTEMRAGLFLFGNLYLGFALPLSAQNSIGTGRCWHVPPSGPVGVASPGSWGGHCVPAVQFDRHGLTVVTWGALQRLDWEFLRTYCDEAYCVLSREWISATGLSESQFSLEQLQADLAAL